MNVRCQYCRNAFNLSRDYMQGAVAEAVEQKQNTSTLNASAAAKQ
jgi:hypothetical protein